MVAAAADVPQLVEVFKRAQPEGYAGLIRPEEVLPAEQQQVQPGPQVLLEVPLEIFAEVVAADYGWKNSKASA